jgi:hypothetical protein
VRPGNRRIALGGFGVLIRKNWGEHRLWIVFIIIVAALSALWYVSIVKATGWEDRPSGSSGALFLFGIAGGSICLFEFLLWPRKHLRVLRIGRAQTWMRAHIWLGLLAVPLLLLHSGFRFGNLEANVLLILFSVVILSGVWGLYMQQYIPQKLLEEVPAETIYSQINHIANLMVEKGDELVTEVCGETTSAKARPSAIVAAMKEVAEVNARTLPSGKQNVGSVRVVGEVELEEEEPAPEPVPGAEPLREFFDGTLADYLKRGKRSGSELAVADRAKARFDDLRLRVPGAAHETVAALEDLAERRRQLDRQASLHFWLHNWLWVHLPISLALIILMFVHIFVTMKYWWPS